MDSINRLESGFVSVSSNLVSSRFCLTGLRLNLRVSRHADFPTGPDLLFAEKCETNCGYDSSPKPSHTTRLRVRCRRSWQWWIVMHCVNDLQGFHSSSATLGVATLPAASKSFVIVASKLYIMLPMNWWSVLSQRGGTCLERAHGKDSIHMICV